MADYSDVQTEKALKDLEKKLNKEYKQAYKEAQKTVTEYFAKFEVRDNELREALKDGTYPMPKGASAGMTPEEHYKQWRLNQIARGRRWEAVRNDLADKMTQTNEIAAKMINQGTAEIYALNHNFSAYTMAMEGYDNIAWNIYNEEAVENLMKGENHTEFRTVSVNRARDYAWNQSRIQSALTSAILQGKSIKHLTDDFMQVMGNNRNAAIRNARTAYTSAQNAGRIEQYKEAEAMGIEMEQEWIATEDNRTRDSHRELDGVRVGVGKYFPNGCRYPGDPQGRPEEVYNCRCTVRAILPKYNGEKRTNKDIGTYQKWLESMTR